MWKLLIYFSCLINLVNTSSTTLKSSGKSRPPCLVPNLRGKAFSLSPMSMMLCVCVCVCVCVCEVTQSCPTLRPHGLQAPLSMGFSRQEYWSGLPFPSPRALPSPGIEPRSPALQADTLSSEPPGKATTMMLLLLLLSRFSHVRLCASMMLAVGYSYVAFIMLKKCPSILALLNVFIIKEYWVVSKTFSSSTGMIMCLFPWFSYVYY